MSSTTNAVLDCTGHRATITFRTEAGLNVASVEFMNELEQALDAIAAKPELRFVVLQGEGKVFLAGANIKAMVNYNEGQAREMAELGHRVFNKLEQLEQVTVAAVHGAAMGGGCEIMLACDFRIAVKTTKIGQPEVLLGLIPGWGGTLRLPRIIPLSMAKRLMFTGESMKAEDLLPFGLVDEAFNSQEDLGPFVDAFLDKMVKAGPQAIALVKKSLHTGKEIDCFAACFNNAESKEGMKAFLEKRPASWTS